MSETQLKCTTRHIRIFTCREENGELVPDPKHLTLDLDPDNEFIWSDTAIKAVNSRFSEIVGSYSNGDLTEYVLRKIGSELEGTIRELLQRGELSYNQNCRVLNYSMGLPRTTESL